MKVLLDHCVHKGLGRHLPGHDVTHTSTLGWGNLQNGHLLRAAVEDGFDCLVTVDKGLQHQQNVSKLGLAVITVQSRDVSLQALMDYVPMILDAIEFGAPGIAISLVKPKD